MIFARVVLVFGEANRHKNKPFALAQTILCLWIINGLQRYSFSLKYQIADIKFFLSLFLTFYLYLHPI